MDEKIWWYLVRSSGIVALVLLGACLLWGILLTTRILRRIDHPAWLLDLHRWLGALTVIFTVIHLLALVADDYLTFGIVELFVPFTSEWRPGAVAWGIMAFWLLFAVQFSSMFMRRLPRPVWRRFHLLGYLSFWTASIHGATSGADSGHALYRWGSLVGLSVLVMVTAFRLLPVPPRQPDPPTGTTPEPAPAGTVTGT